MIINQKRLKKPPPIIPKMINNSSNVHSWSSAETRNRKRLFFLLLLIKIIIIRIRIAHVSSSSYDMYPHYSYPYYGYYCHMTCILLLLIWHMCPPPHYEYYCHFINIFSHHYYLLLSKITNNCNDFWTFLPAGDGMLAERACTRVAENLVERAQWCVQLYPCAGGFRL